MIYNVNVTQLPGGGDGPERFPLRMELRNVTGISSMLVRNLTVSPIDAAGFQTQSSFAGVMVRPGVGDIFAVGTGEQPFDACVDFLDRDEGIDIVTIPWTDVGGGNAAAGKWRVTREITQDESPVFVRVTYDVRGEVVHHKIGKGSTEITAWPHLDVRDQAGEA